MIFGLMFDPIFVPHFSELKSFDLASIPHFFKFKLLLLEPAPKNRMTNKVYLGKKLQSLNLHKSKNPNQLLEMR